MTPKEVRQKWTAALRSGDYVQGKRFLHKKDEFCCLGVLCELAVKEGVIPPPVQEEDYYLYDGRTGRLPWPVRDWAGLSSDAGGYHKEGELQNSTYLTRDNDSYNLNFNQIADIIDSEPEGFLREEK